MTIERDYVLAYLRKLEKQYGGYFGTDILNLAKEMGVTWHGLRKKLHEWFEEDPDFSIFRYLGRHRPSITLNEFAEIESRIVSNPLEVKSHIYSDINKERADLEPIREVNNDMCKSYNRSIIFKHPFR